MKFAPHFEAIDRTIKRALTSAGLDTSSTPMRFVTDTIEQALRGRQPGVTAADRAADDARTIDASWRFVDVPGIADAEAAMAPPRAAGGRTERHAFVSPHGTRAYGVYTPAGRQAQARPMPVIVMLHGCTQSADDFAAGTGMNRLADAHGLLVVYPEQDAQANPSRCWNWFQPQDQHRDGGEPAILAGILQEVGERHDVDRRQVFVAGLSAGAAMAVVLAEAYPELIAAVGAHSGLPYACAQDIPSALARMKGGRSGLPGRRAAEVGKARPVRAVPTIVFHGDRDHTVHLSNGKEIVERAVRGTTQRSLSASTSRGTSAGGRSFERTVYADAAGHAQVEQWVLHGAGHAWSGGSAAGSYTDPTGPDASAEMVRFFLGVMGRETGVD